MYKLLHTLPRRSLSQILFPKKKTMRIMYRRITRIQHRLPSCRFSSQPVFEEEAVLENSRSRTRPRLQALRKQLQEGDPKVTTTFTTPKTYSNPTSVEDLRKFIAQLPPAPSQELLLTDRFQRQHKYLRISLTERCNLRCTYCMPEEGVPLQPKEHLLSRSEIQQIASFFSQHGVSKFRLTGGEPTLRHDILEILQDLNQFKPKQLGMTTNAVTLAKNVQQYVEAGLNSVNISLDTLDPLEFEKLTRRPASYLDRVLQGLEAALAIPELKTKVNCVVTPQNVSQINNLIGLTNQYPHLTVRFIEFMPFTANGWDTKEFVSYQEMLKIVDTPLIADPSDDPSDTTKYYRTANGGKVGFITSMSNNFCGTCNRLRITADGQLKVCLFDGTSHVSLRDALRNDMDMNKLVWAALQTKEYALGGHGDAETIAKNSQGNRPMTLIGG